MNGAVSDAEALEAVTLFPKWKSGTEYEAGKRVRYEGGLYKCLQEHTAQADWTPVAAVSLWARVLAEAPEWEQPGSTEGYATGDRVTHNGKVWESILDNNVWEPGVYGWVETE